LRRGYNEQMPSRKTKRALIDQPKTEQRLAASGKLDRMTSAEIVRLMNREDRNVAAAVGQELAAIARAVDAIVEGIRGGGRLIYVGAGSSGRMALLDATECPPTFGVSRNVVQAMIAGGKRAITEAVEGAEDAERNGEHDLRAEKLSRKDVVVGITASGTTPYVVGALEYARKRGTATVAITANRRSRIARAAKILIAPETGAEVLTGSTRLKAGTAQKMVLNMLSTAAMARLGHVYENLMIDVAPTNKKLSGRSVGILAAASGQKMTTAERASRQAGHNLRVALVTLKLGIGAQEAKRRINACDGDLRKALGE